MERLFEGNTFGITAEIHRIPTTMCMRGGEHVTDEPEAGHIECPECVCRPFRTIEVDDEGVRRMVYHHDQLTSGVRELSTYVVLELKPETIRRKYTRAAGWSGRSGKEVSPVVDAFKHMTDTRFVTERFEQSVF